MKTLEQMHRQEEVEIRR